jgi:hypothetical protein
VPDVVTSRVEGDLTLFTVGTFQPNTTYHLLLAVLRPKGWEEDKVHMQQYTVFTRPVEEDSRIRDDDDDEEASIQALPLVAVERDDVRDWHDRWTSLMKQDKWRPRPAVSVAGDPATTDNNTRLDDEPRQHINETKTDDEQSIDFEREQIKHLT